MRHTLPFLLLLPLAAVRAGESEAFFESKVRPLLADQCNSCHSESAKKLKGDLKLDTQAGWLRGGSSGPAVVPGKPDDSPLIQAVRRDHKEVSAMPPDAPLSKEQVAILEQWVKAGAVASADKPAAKKTETVAEAKARWPFTPVPTAVPVPAVTDAGWPKSDIDRFILAKLEAKGLRPVADADKRPLLRRATFDLTGLPPTPAEVEAFLKDTTPEAFERVVDRLLASPHYGERWGRHWLDVARYSDTAGDNSDFPIPQMAQYRDWVIDAINADLPYDQFVRQQIAGDLMPGGTEEEKKQRTIATGYLANARRFGSTVPDYPWHLTIEDTLDNLGRAFLGLTLNCARCHDHKFDPVGMSDYYALYGIFASTRYPWPGIELEQRQRDLVVFAPADAVKAEMARREKANKEYDAEIKRLDDEKKKVAGDDKRKEDELRKRQDALKEKQRKDTGGPLPFPTAYAVADGPKAADAAVQLKGDPKKPAAVVRRRFLQVLGGQGLAECGVRFIELIDFGSSNNWDAHDDMKQHEGLARQIDKPIAGLLTDLKRTGLLDDTLVVWTTEFGRTPGEDGKYGRGHHSACFSSWLAGAGVKAGSVYGETDEIAATVAKDRVHVHDFHATLLHLLGLDHEKLTYRHGGRDYRLTDVHGNVVTGLLTG